MIQSQRTFLETGFQRRTVCKIATGTILAESEAFYKAFEPCWYVQDYLILKISNQSIGIASVAQAKRSAAKTAYRRNI